MADRDGGAWANRATPVPRLLPGFILEQSWQEVREALPMGIGLPKYAFIL